MPVNVPEIRCGARTSNIPKPAGARTSEGMEQSDMFRERNEWLSTEAKRRSGTASGSYLQLPREESPRAKDGEGRKSTLFNSLRR